MSMVRKPIRNALSAALSAAMIPAFTAAALAQATPPPGGTIAVELNKLQDREEGGCTAYLVYSNQTTSVVSELNLLVYVFDQNSVIVGTGFLLSASDLSVGGPSVRSVVLPEVEQCSIIRSMLVAEVDSCESNGVALATCNVTTTTRSTVPLNRSP